MELGFIKKLDAWLTEYKPDIEELKSNLAKVTNDPPMSLKVKIKNTCKLLTSLINRFINMCQGDKFTEVCKFLRRLFLGMTLVINCMNSEPMINENLLYYIRISAHKLIQISVKFLQLLVQICQQWNLILYLQM
jgi:hypothetical protein